MVRHIVEFILFGSIFLGICTVGLCMETDFLLNLPLNHFSFYAFVFGATLTQYNLHYLIKKSLAKSSHRYAWQIKNKYVYKILGLTGSILMLVSLFSFQRNDFILLFIMGLITLVYSFPLLPFAHRKRIKDFGLLKIITLVLLWTIVTVWFPTSKFFFKDLNFQLVFAGRFLFLFVLCIMFDIRDMEADKTEHIRTIPLLSGIKNTYIIAYFILSFFVTIVLIQYSYNYDLNKLIVMLLSSLATVIIIELSKKKRSDIFYLAGVDGMMLLQAFLVITCS